MQNSKKRKPYLIGLLALIVSFGVVVSTQAGNYATTFHPLTGERKIVTVGDPLAFDGGFLLETPTNNFNSLESEQIRIDCQSTEDCPQELGSSVVTRYRTRLSSSMTSTQSNVPVSSVESFDGTTLTMALLGGKVFLTIEPGTDREEIVKCESISSTTWDTCTRGLAFTGTDETSVANNRKAHNAGSIVVMSNVHYVYEQLTDKDSDETIGGIKTFTNLPLWADGATLSPTSSAQLATKLYVDAVGGGGFTAGNIGGGLTLRANGTSPETLDVNTTTVEILKSFTIDSDGYFGVSTTTGQKIDTHWNDRFNATSTHPGGFTFGGGLTADNATTTGNHIISGNATTTGSFHFTELIDSNNNSVSSIGQPTYATSTIQNLEETNGLDIVSFTIPAGKLKETGGIRIKTNLKFTFPGDSSTISLGYSLKFGGNEVITCSYGAGSSGGMVINVGCEAVIINRTATNQIYIANKEATFPGIAGSVVDNSEGELNVDTTAEVVVEVETAYSTNSNPPTINIGNAIVEYIWSE